MRALSITFVSLVSLAACAGDHHGGDDSESYNCETETRDDEFVVGLTKMGNANQLSFKLLSATPAPPARDDNTWLLQLDASTGPMANATVTVTPFMPDHQHGTPIAVEVEAMPTAGQYTLSPINMWMPGLWEITISATAAEPAVDDSTVFRFCIPS